MATIKVTKRDYFNALKAFVNGEKLAYPAEDVKSFLDNEIELLNRKASRSSSKPTKNQIENEAVKTNIVNVITSANKPITISEMMVAPELAGNSNQKLSALAKQLVDAGVLIRITDKKKSLFGLPEWENENPVEDAPTEEA